MIINSELTNEAIKQLAPSAFAITPYHKQSDRYAFIPTSQVIDGMRAAGFVPVQASQSRTKILDKKDFTKHLIRFRAVGSLGQRAIVGDSVLEAVLINSHDGTSAYKLFAGIFRFVCSNGLVVADSLVGSVNIRHSGNVLQEVVESTSQIFEDAPKVLEVIGKWSNIQLAGEEQLALATAAHTVRFPETDKAPVTPDRLLRARRYEDQGSDLWKTFNRIQENSTKGIRGRRGHGTRGVKNIDGNINLNRALFSLAQRMAELKAA